MSDRQSAEDGLTYTIDEILESFKKVADIGREVLCTFNACLICSNATNDSKPLHLKKEDNLVHLGEVSELNKTDIELEQTFAGCIESSDKKCHVAREYIEGQTWQDFDLVSSQGEGKEKLNMDKSYMICTKYGGIIYFHSHGQELEPLMNGERLYYLSEEYRQWVKIAEGMSFVPYRSKNDSDDAKAIRTTTIGIGITFDEEGSNWEYLREVLGWSDADINLILDMLWKDDENESTDVNIENTKYVITEEQAWQLFDVVAREQYIPQVNSAIEAYNKKNGSITTYSQCELEAMYDYAYNNGLAPSDGLQYSEKIDGDDYIIYYYLRKDQVGAVDAVKAAQSDNRRRMNQMNLFFYEEYDFLDKSDEELDPLREKLGF